ncbi:hypothetical protein, partial [Ectopseudomonas guguanensis]|uniref:hypothetical protein n=1 Tax=Ectopseudomonas guguanensis TaxID=1198456 RepID=UPI00286792EF
FKDYQESVMKDTLSNSKQTYEDMVGFVIFAVILSILVISLTVVLMLRSTSKDLQSITKVIKNIDFKN